MIVLIGTTGTVGRHVAHELIACDMTFRPIRGGEIFEGFFKPDF